jgi:hypothetical protein
MTQRNLSRGTSCREVCREFRLPLFTFSFSPPPSFHPSFLFSLVLYTTLSCHRPGLTINSNMGMILALFVLANISYFLVLPFDIVRLPPSLRAFTFPSRFSS